MPSSAWLTHLLHIFGFLAPLQTTKMPEQHTILGGKVYVYKRPNSNLWQCSSYFAGKNRRTSTKEESLSKAKEIAEDWYLQLRGKLRAGEIKSEKTFRDVSEVYLHEYDIITQGQRNKRYVDGQHWRSSVHLVPFFGNLGISEITAGKIQEYRIHRHQEAITKRGKPPGHSTMHQEIVTRKGNKMRSVAVPLWVKQEIDGWLDVAGIEKGPIFRRVLANGRVGKDALTERAVWQLVREYAAQIGIGELAPHDLRRTAAKLCRSKGGELEQIQFLLGHESILTTERYLGSEQDLKNAVNDALVFE
jgi:integrase